MKEWIIRLFERHTGVSREELAEVYLVNHFLTRDVLKAYWRTWNWRPDR